MGAKLGVLELSENTEKLRAMRGDGNCWLAILMAMEELGMGEERNLEVGIRK